jgi:hypothetical protein
MLRPLGVALDGTALMLGDNMSVVLNTTVPSSILKKKHNAIAYQRVREAITARIMEFVYIKSEENVSDVLTKALSNEKFHYYMINIYINSHPDPWFLLRRKIVWNLFSSIQIEFHPY